MSHLMVQPAARSSWNASSHSTTSTSRSSTSSCRSAPDDRSTTSLRSSSLKLNRQQQQQQQQSHRRPSSQDRKTSSSTHHHQSNHKMRSRQPSQLQQIMTTPTTRPSTSTTSSSSVQLNGGMSTGTRRRSALIRRSCSFGASALGGGGESSESPASVTTSPMHEKEKVSPVSRHLNGGGGWRASLPPLSNSPVLNSNNNKRTSMPTSLSLNSSHHHVHTPMDQHQHQHHHHANNLQSLYNNHHNHSNHNHNNGWANRDPSGKHKYTPFFHQRQLHVLLYRLVLLCLGLGMTGFLASLAMASFSGDTNVTTTDTFVAPDETAFAENENNPQQALQQHEQQQQAQQESEEQSDPDTNNIRRPTSKARLRSKTNSQNQLRRSLTSLLLAKSITTTERLQDPFSPASNALDWLIDVSSRTWQLGDSDILARFALACLFFATHTTGSLWKIETHWMALDETRVNICEWHGIGCDVDRTTQAQVVRRVNLTDNGLQGTIPLEFYKGLASHLVELDLSHNQLWGTLPSQQPYFDWDRTTFPKLHTLYLHHNAMTGTVPANLKSMKTILQNTHLKHVSLKYNHFEGMSNNDETGGTTATKRRNRRRQQQQPSTVQQQPQRQADEEPQQQQGREQH